MYKLPAFCEARRQGNSFSTRRQNNTSYTSVRKWTSSRTSVAKSSFNEELVRIGRRSLSSTKKISKKDKQEVIQERTLREQTKRRLKRKGEYTTPAVTDPLRKPDTNAEENEKEHPDIIGKCTGCGAFLQETDPHKLGYVPPNLKGSRHTLEISTYNPEDDGLLIEQKLQQNEQTEEVENPETPPEVVTENTIVYLSKPTVEKVRRKVCQRCWTLKMHNRVLPVHIPFEQFKEQLKELKHKRILVLKIVDLFDLSGSFVSRFRTIIGDNPVVLVANKMDLLPKHTSLARVTTYLKHAAEEQGLDLKDVFLISSETGEGIDTLIRNLDKLRDGRDVYVIGASNTGKSTFINKIMEMYKLPRKVRPVTSHIPGTTLNILSVPLGKKNCIYDTPGLYSENQFVNLLTPEELKIVLPTNRLIPAAFTFSPGHTLFLGGMARIDYISGKHNVMLTAFVSHKLYMHKTKTEKADELYERQLGKLLQPPLNLTDRQGKPPFPPLVPETFNLKSPGWVAVTGHEELQLRVWTPEGLGIVIRTEPFLPYEKPVSGAKRKVFFSKKNSPYEYWNNLAQQKQQQQQEGQEHSLEDVD